MDDDWNYEVLADEMLELVFFVGGKRKKWDELPRLVRRILATNPSRTEIIRFELAVEGWSLRSYSKAECPDDLLEIIERAVRLDDLDFGREALIVVGWEDPPGTWMYWPLSVAICNQSPGPA